MEIYRSKIDYWLVGTMYLITLAPTIPAVIYAFSWTMVFLVVLLLAFASTLIFNTKYIIENETLSIKCGFLPTEKYSIQQIQEIRNTHTIMAAPAISLDRIEIRLTGRNAFVISPQDKHKFIAHLCAINPNISVKQAY